MSKYLGRGDDSNIKGCIKASNNRLRNSKHNSETIIADCDAPPAAEVIEFVIKLSKATRPLLLFKTLNKYLKGYVSHVESKF